MKNRLLSIMDKSKKRTGAILICLVLILTLCTSLVLAANTYAPEDVTLYTADDTLQFDPEKDTNETVLIEGRISLAYTGDDGEAVLRVTYDGGATWYIQDENDYLTLDPDISATEWLTYEEFRAWIDQQDATDEKIAEYEAMLEKFVNFNNGTEEDIIKAGIGMTAIRGVERPFLCTVSRSYYDYEAGAISDSTLTAYESGISSYAIDDFEATDEWIAEYMENNGVTVQSFPVDEGEVAVYDSATSKTTINGVELTEEQIASYDFVSDNMDNSGARIEMYYGNYIAHQTQMTQYEYFTVVGDDKLGVCADTYKELYKIVRDFFEEKIQESEMTREEADSRLAEMSEENTRTVVFFDEEGNIINN